MWLGRIEKNFRLTKCKMGRLGDREVQFGGVREAGWGGVGAAKNGGLRVFALVLGQQDSLKR
jgi:hypothetical protein